MQTSETFQHHMAANICSRCCFFSTHRTQSYSPYHEGGQKTELQQWCRLGQFALDPEDTCDYHTL